MSHAPGKLLFLVLGALAVCSGPLSPSYARAASPGAQSLTGADQALRAATLATHKTLLAYSPLLQDLVAAYHVSLAQGQLPSATSRTSIDPRLRHRLQTLHTRALQIRPAGLLPPLARVYHLRSTAALQHLADAATLGQLLAPSQALMGALLHLQAAERDLVVAHSQGQRAGSLEVNPVWPGPLDEPLQRLQRLVGLMSEKPRPQTTGVQASLACSGQKTVTSTILWSGSAADPRVGQRLQICRQDDAQGAWACQDDIDIKAGSHQEQLPLSAWSSPPAYRLSTVSPFGVRSRARTVTSRLTGGRVQAPSAVTATSLAPAADAPEFYEWLDAVAVSWRLSNSDTDLSGWDQTLPGAPPHRLAGYRIYRLQQSDANALQDLEGAALVRRLQPFEVGHVGAGIDTFTDRPHLSALADGLVYAVAAVALDGSVQSAPTAVQGPQRVQLDLRPALKLAAAGVSRVHKPLAWEVRRAAVLARPGAQRVARNQFAALSDVARRAHWSAFWRGAQDAEKQAWWERGPALYDAQQLRQKGDMDEAQLSQAALQTAQLALYAEAHEDVLAAVEQHWALLDESDRQRAQAAQRKGGPLWLSVMPPKNASMQAANVWPRQLAAWWRSRDAAQVAAVASWWHDLTPAARKPLLDGWIGRLGEPARHALLWPPWQALTEPEKNAWLKEPSSEVPDALWPRFLAHMEFAALPLAGQVAAVRQDVGPHRSVVAQLRYGVRPLDRWLDFNLLVALTFISLGLLSGCLLGFAHERQEGPHHR